MQKMALVVTIGLSLVRFDIIGRHTAPAISSISPPPCGDEEVFPVLARGNI